MARRAAAAACWTRWKRVGLPRRSSQGAASTRASRTTGAIVAITSASSLPLKMPTVANITAPRMASARMLSMVCETIVPSTTGKRWRTRPTRRDRISARDGSPRRAGSVADIRTPIIVARAVSRRRTRTPGSAARRIACQASARSSIEAHMTANAASTHTGVAASSARPIDSIPIRWSASAASPAPATTPAPTSTRRAARAARRRPADGLPRLERRQPPRWHAGPRLRGCDAHAPPEAGRPALGRGRRERLLVDLGDLGGHVRPGVALRALARVGSHMQAPFGVEREAAQRLAQLDRVPDRHEQAVAAVVNDLAIAGDPGRHDRCAGGERLREDHPEALAAQ